MTRKAIAVVLCVLTLSGISLADYEIHNIDGEFSAIFPSKPRFEGEFESGKQIVRSYNHTDETNLIVYTATYQINETHFGDVATALKYAVEGQAGSVGGTVESFESRNIGGNESAVFLLTYKYQGVLVRKFGAISYKDGQFYQWAVQDFPSMSKLDAQTIFYRYLSQFKVR